jgi:hypothetical protein
MTIPRLEQARHAGGYSIWLRFADGTEGEVDFEGELTGPVFEPLRDKERFLEFRVHPELHTLVWDNGADFAPEFLYEQVRIPA